MKSYRKIAVLTSGGDAPGMNSCVRAIARRAAEEGIETLGVIGGYRGLIDDEMIELTSAFTANISGQGGTAIYTDRCPEFMTEEGMQKAIATCRRHGIEAIVAIGGDGTFRGATDLSVHGIPTIGVTGTIDNDITATDYTVGFDTALNTCMEIVNNLQDTCESHARCNVVEFMGRHCGELTLKVGIATGAVAVAIPEVPFDEEAAFNNIKALRANGQRSMIVCVCEGVYNEDGSPYSETLAKKIKEVTGVDTKFCRPAHVQRGGRPTLRDRLTATEMGAYAIDLLLEGKSDVVVCEINGEIKTEDICWALAADSMYKNKLKPGALDRFSNEDIERMKALCAKRKADIIKLYDLNIKLANDH